MDKFEKKRANLEEIIEKNKIGFFWEAYTFFVTKAGYAEESAFAECIFYFGEDAMWNNIISIKGMMRGREVRLIMYYDANFHPNLNNLIEFCLRNNLDIQRFGVEVKEITVDLTSQAVMGYLVLMYKKIKNKEFPELERISDLANGGPAYGGTPDDLRRLLEERMQRQRELERMHQPIEEDELIRTHLANPLDGADRIRRIIERTR